MKTKEFPVKPFLRIAKKSGIKRISKSALKTLRNLVLEEAEEIAEEIVKITKYTGRKTVMKKDIEFVLQRKNIMKKIKK